MILQTPGCPCIWHIESAVQFLSETSMPLHMAEKTLQSMAAGGMYDHVGGGFHRYSVDEHWHVPHFEKVAILQFFAGSTVSQIVKKAFLCASSS